MLSWCTVVGWYAYEVNFGGPEADQVDGSVVLVEGDSWMLLTRDDDDVGFMHEARTRVEDGWLLEYEFVVNISTLGINQLIKTDIKARVDQGAILRQVHGSVDTGPARFEFKGHVEGDELVVSHDLGGAEKTRRIPIDAKPRLSNNAFNQLAAMGEVEPGAVFEQEYFDPVFMDMRPLRFEFVRRHTLNVYDRKVETNHFKQKLGGDELDVYIDLNGEVQIQELPMRMVAARIPNVVGRTKARALVKQFEEGGEVEVEKVSIGDAYSILRGENILGQTHVWRLSNFPESISILLDSGAQKAVQKGRDSARVDTGKTADLPAVDAEVASQHVSISEEARQAVKQAGLVDELDEKASSAQVVESLARAVTRRVDKNVDPLPRFDAWTAHERAEQPEEDGWLATEISRILEREKALTSLEASTLLVAAARVAGIPSRLVLGFQQLDDSENTVVPHVWVQYFDGQHYDDIDPSRTTLLPGLIQVQVALADDFITLSDLLVLEDMDVEYSRDAEATADFD